MYKTEQEHFWAGEFGNAYIDRNQSDEYGAANLAFFSRILSRVKIGSAIEFGANIGLNLETLRTLLPDADLAAVEINELAASQIRKDVEVYRDSILNFEPSQKWDLSFTKGVLIHINPESLPAVYDRLYQASRRYILVAEYYNTTPVEVPYRGHAGKLFKRDFAGELIDRFNLKLVDYAFVYRRDTFSQDDMTWFLLERC